MKGIVHAQIKRFYKCDANFWIHTRLPERWYSKNSPCRGKKKKTIIPIPRFALGTVSQIMCAVKEFNLTVQYPVDLLKWLYEDWLQSNVVAAHIYLRYKWGSSNSTITSRTSLQKGDPWKKKKLELKLKNHKCLKIMVGAVCQSMKQNKSYASSILLRTS